MARATESNNFTIIPESDGGVPDATIKRISNSGGHVRDQYDEEAYRIGGSTDKNNNSLGKQISSWVATWDTIIDYLVYALRFLSQIAILAWALMFIYAGYKYVSSAISGSGWVSNDILLYAIGGMLVVIFSYAIMRILTNMFLL